MVAVFVAISSHAFADTGKASCYGGKFHGRKTANGEIYNQYGLTAAHKAFKFGTNVKVTNVANGKSVIVRINDRGPFIKERIIDLSKGAFQRIADIRQGIVKVRLDVVK